MMKRVLFALCMLLPLLASAQETKSYMFNFKDPGSLNPPFDKTLLEYEGDETNVNNEVYYSDDHAVRIRFDKGTQGRVSMCRGYNDSIWYNPMRYDAYGKKIAQSVVEDYFLFVGRTAEYIIEATGNAALVSSEFSTDSKIGNSKLQSPTGVGTVDSRENWYANGAEGVTQLVYHNHGQMPEIRGITVTYKTNAKVEFTPSSYAPANGSELLAGTFNTLTMNFSENVDVASGAIFTLTGPSGFSTNLGYIVSGTTVILSLPSSVKLETLGQYSLTVPAGTISYKTTYGSNSAFTYRFTVVEKSTEPDPVDPDPVDPDPVDPDPTPVTPTEVLGLVSVTPADGTKLEAIPTGATVENSIVVKFASAISNTFGEEKPCVLNYLGETLATADPVWTDVDMETFQTQSVRLKLSAEITADGRYTLVIPAGTVFSSDRKAANEEIRVTYTIGDLNFLTDAQLAQIDKLLENEGVGYPAAGSASRKALEGMRQSEIGTAEDLAAAVAAFYAEAEVTLPENDRYYTITAVNADGKELYIQYITGKWVIVTDEKDEATHFKAVANGNGTVSFETPDGKYLTQMYKSEDNFTETNTAAVNGLTLKRLELDGKTPEQLFGLFSINTVETDAESVSHPVYTLVNYNNIAFETSVLNTLKYFDATRTNAFRFDETTKPAEQQITVEAILTPAAGSTVDVFNSITVGFTNSDKATISYNSNKDIVLKGDSEYKATVNLVNGVATLTFNNVVAGTYTLTIPEGAFTYTYGGKTENVAAVSATYTVKGSGETPVTPVDPTIVTAVVSPASGTTLDALNTINVSFNNASGLTVNYNSANTITLAGTDNSRSYTATVAANGTNKYTLTVSGVTAGGYKLTIPAGTFYTTQNGTNVNVAQLTANYTVKAQEQDLTGFGNFQEKYFNDMFVVGATASEYKYNTQIGEMYIVVTQTNFPFTLTGKTVKIYKNDHQSTWVADAHFEIVNNYQDENFGTCTALKLVLDTNLYTAALATGEYLYFVAAGTYGDGNYGKYLADPTSVAKSNCYVNSAWSYITSIFNKNDFKATLQEIKDVVKQDSENLDYIRQNVNYEDQVAVDLLAAFENALQVLQNSIPVAENLLNTDNYDAPMMGSMQDQFTSVIRNLNFVRSLVLMKPTPLYAKEYVTALNNSIKSLQATGIGDIATDTQRVDGKGMYDLTGRKVDGQPVRGIYIVRGRKVLVK